MSLILTMGMVRKMTQSRMSDAQALLLSGVCCRENALPSRYGRAGGPRTARVPPKVPFRVSRRAKSTNA